MLFLCQTAVWAQDKGFSKGKKNNVVLKDTTISLKNLTPPDSTVKSSLSGDSTKKDSSIKIVDRKTILLDSLKKTSDLQEAVSYSAEDSVVFEVENEKLYLYNQTKINYTDLEINAYKVRVDWKDQTMYAEGLEDSVTGKGIGRPTFKQGENNYSSKSMTYNFKSQKGRIVGARTVEGDGFIFGETVKRLPNNTFNVASGKYTTCNDPDHPHFYIQSKKLKVIPNDKIISGPLNFVLEDFPLPLVIPFGFFPNQKNRKSGIILPKYSGQSDKGIGLMNLGYYWKGTQYFDALFNGDIYSNGSWRLGLQSKYSLRNHFSGNVSFNYGVQRQHEKTDPDFNKLIGWNLQLLHSQKINQNTNISASISIDKRFNRTLNYNQNYSSTNNYFAQTQSSSITFNKSKIGNTPFAINAGATMRQDVDKSLVSLTLPSMSISMVPQLPFKNVLASKKSMDWLHQISFGYSLNADNQYNQVPDSNLFNVMQFRNKSFPYAVGDSIYYKKGFEFVQNGIFQSIPINTKIKLLRYININPSFNYEEYWYLKSVQKAVVDSVLQTTSINGFQTARVFQASVAATTTFYAIYQLKGKRQRTFRHAMIPNISYNYRPDFSADKWGYYGTYTDINGKTVKYNYFEGNSRLPSSGESQAINFTLNNMIEMKYLKKNADEITDSKTDKFERTRLVDGIGLSTGYNFAADSLNFSPLALNARLNKGKLSFSGNANFSPYNVTKTGRIINQYYFQANPNQLLRFTNAQLSVSTRFEFGQNKDKKKSKGFMPNHSADFDSLEYAYIMRNYSEYIDFDVPFSMSLNYNFSVNKSTPTQMTLNNTLNFNGDLKITPKWVVSYSSGLTLGKTITDEGSEASKKWKFNATNNTSFSLTRDLHCWTASFTWVPFGPTQSYNLVLNIKSSTLQDLRITKRNSWTDRFR